jgi:ATP-dependent DNA helicase RecG
MYKLLPNSVVRDVELIRALDAIQAGGTPADFESYTLEFKEEGKSIDDTLRELAHTAVCFANAGGGVLVVGVADKLSGLAALKGTQLDRAQVQRRIFELSRPPLTVDIIEDIGKGARLLFVFVPQSFEIHSDPQGRSPRRIGTDCIPMDPSQQMRLREERLGVDWSAQDSGIEPSEVSSQALTTARQMLSSTLAERRKLAKLSDKDLLSALGVLTPAGRLLRAGELLFCSRTTGPAIVYEFKTTPGGEPKTVERLEPPLLLAFQRTLELVQARRNTTAVTLPDGVQIQIEDFPELAVREALANAVIHRDYHLTQPVQVEHSPDIFKVSSPGPLVSGVTPENILTHPSKPRNPALTKAVRQLGLAEEIGRGVDRMFREMVRAGRDVPKIESRFDSVVVAFAGGAANANVARFVASLSADEREDTDTLLILFRLCSVSTVRAPDLSEFLQKGADECEVVLRRLASDTVGMLEPTRSTARRAMPAYRLRSEALKALGTAVPYQRRTMDDIDRKIFAHVREYRIVTNRTVQNLLDVGLQRAKQILADLVRRRLLVKVSAHERGPGVEYGPGPQFPSRKVKQSRATARDRQLPLDLKKGARIPQPKKRHR